LRLFKSHVPLGLGRRVPEGLCTNWPLSALVRPCRGLSEVVGRCRLTSALTLSPSEKETEEPNTPLHRVGVGGQKVWQKEPREKKQSRENHKRRKPEAMRS